MRVSKELLIANDSKGFSGKLRFQSQIQASPMKRIGSQNQKLVIFLAGPLFET